MNIFEMINLPAASKYLVSLILKKGGTLDVLPGTNAYVCGLKGKEYIFLGEFTPLTPYMYGVVFSNQKYWFEILKELKMKFAWEPKKTEKKITLLITKDGFYNAVLEKNTVLLGDGKTSLRNLIKKENIERINSKGNLVTPIKVGNEKIKLNRIPKDYEEIEFQNIYDYEDLTPIIDKDIVKNMKKIINFLPGLPFVRMEIFTKDLKNSNKFTLGKVLVSPGANIFFNLTDGDGLKDTGKTLISLMPVLL